MVLEKEKPAKTTRSQGGSLAATPTPGAGSSSTSAGGSSSESARKKARPDSTVESVIIP